MWYGNRNVCWYCKLKVAWLESENWNIKKYQNSWLRSKPQHNLILYKCHVRGRLFSPNTLYSFMVIIRLSWSKSNYVSQKNEANELCTLLDDHSSFLGSIHNIFSFQKRFKTCRKLSSFQNCTSSRSHVNNMLKI